jgi:undecaprenyl diphosphate synthase
MVHIEARNLPAHIGIIMDGNGRWAQQRGNPRALGHQEGARAVRRIVRAARRIGVNALTLYAFSEQNWSRPEDEIEGLMGLLLDFLSSEREEILENSIRLRAVGNVSRLPSYVRPVLEALAKDSADNEGMTLTLALSYGGREEIVDAARALAEEAIAGKINAADIDEKMLHAKLPSLTVGDPDLVIRTGGDFRISNFLLYGLAYAELHFTDVLWPDFDTRDLFEAIASYQGRERRFGLVGKPAAPIHVVPEPPAANPGEKIAAQDSPPESQRKLRIAR